MRLIKIAARVLLILVGCAAALAAVGYWGLDYRVRLDGSGRPTLVRLRPPESHAAVLEAHRSAQRESHRPSPAGIRSPPAAVPVAAPAVLPAPAVAERASAAPSAPAPRQEAPYWIGFRGPQRDGHYREMRIDTSWPSQGLTPLWKQPIGGGYASFAIAHGRAFTIEQRRQQEVVAAYDVATGRELWAHGWDGEFREWMGGDGPRATPAWHEGRVYALGGLGELRCLEEETGRLVWRVNILEDNAATNLQWGMAASPLVFDDLVVVLPGGPRGRSVVAYDRLSGARRWAVLDDKAAYSSPMLATLGGRRQILAVLARRVVSLEPGSGALLWQHPWVTGNDINAAQPLPLSDRRILLSSAYGHGAAVVEVTETSGTFSVRTVWEHTRLKNRFSSSVLHEGHIFGLDENILTCLDAETGEVKWKAGRYGHGQFVLASGHLVMLSEQGELALIRAIPERHEELVRFPVLEGKTWNHPAIDKGRLIVRNLAEMAAFDVSVR